MDGGEPQAWLSWLAGYVGSWLGDRGIGEEVIAGLVVAILLAFAGTISGCIGWVLRHVWKRAVFFFSARRRLRQLDREIIRVKRQGRWVRPVAPIDRRLQREIAKSIPVLLIANQKGGVGKSTLAANLGAYFAITQAKRVLFVDLDFQGTLSNTLRNIGQIGPDAPALTGLLLTADYRRRAKKGDLDAASQLFERRHRLEAEDLRNQPGNLQYSAFYDAGVDLDRLEDMVMLAWIARRSSADARFQLARFLQNEKVQKNFDLVILDAPPRNTTAGINGLCACTHIVTPTRADDFSWRGAARFVTEASQLQQLLAPQARFIGFIGTMTSNQIPHGQIPDGIARRLDELKTRTIHTLDTGTPKPVLSFWADGSQLDYLGTMATSNAFQDVEQTIPYISRPAARERIRPIGDEIWRRLFPTEAKVDSAAGDSGAGGDRGAR